jgi:hypothetical protein
MNPNNFLNTYSKFFYKGGISGPMEGYRSQPRNKWNKYLDYTEINKDNPQYKYLNEEFANPRLTSGNHPGFEAYRKTAGKLRSFNTLEDAQRAAELFKGKFVQTDTPGSLDARRVRQGPGGSDNTHFYLGGGLSKKEKNYDTFAGYAMRPHMISGTLKDPNIYAMQAMMEGNKIMGNDIPTSKNTFGLDEAEEATKRYLGLQIGRERASKITDRRNSLLGRLKENMSHDNAMKDPRVIALDEKLDRIKERSQRKEKGLKRFIRRGAKDRLAGRGTVKGRYKDQIYGYIDVGGEYGGGMIEGDTEGTLGGLADAVRKIRKSDEFQEFLSQQKGRPLTEKQKTRQKARAERDYSYLNPLNQQSSGPTNLTGFGEGRRATIGEIERRKAVLNTLREQRKERERRQGYEEEELGKALDY